jgi:hypothetical protein
MDEKGSERLAFEGRGSAKEREVKVEQRQEMLGYSKQQFVTRK